MRATAEYLEARKNREYDKTSEMTAKLTTPFNDEWRIRFQTAGKGFHGTEGEIVFAASMLDKRLAKDAGKLVKAMIESHVKSDHLGLLASQFRSLGRGMEREDAVKLIQRIIDENPVVDTKANALYARAMMFSRRDASDDDKAVAEIDLAQIVDLMPKDSLLSMKARGPKFKRDHLQIGMTVPEIEGVDIAGDAFKLSDYRGKVVVLDFWGDW